MRPGLVVPFVAALVAACASGAGSSARTREPTAQRHDANLITEEEIRGQSNSTLHDVIRALRPGWLMVRRPTTLLRQQEGALVVYLDGARFGDAETLRQIRPISVRAVRFYPATEAQARFGPGHLQGAIEVTTAGH
jgi:hypothetical protein